MIFSNKKKLQRDRNVGLVFHWRGGLGINTGGSTLAFLITAMVFACGFVMLNVYAKPNTVPSRYRAQMIQLGTMDDDLSWWVERNSPGLTSVKEAGSEAIDEQVNVKLMEAINQANSGATEYVDVELQETMTEQEDRFLLQNRGMPSLGRLMIEADGEEMPESVVDWKLKVKMIAPLAGRLPDDLEYLEWIPEKWHGRTASLIIAVDASGKVLSVNCTEWTDSKMVRDLENWVLSMRFKPAVGEKNEMDTGVMLLSVVPQKVAKIGKKEGAQ